MVALTFRLGGLWQMTRYSPTFFRDNPELNDPAALAAWESERGVPNIYGPPPVSPRNFTGWSVPQMSPYDRYMSRFRSGAQVERPGPNASADENQAYLDAQRDFRSQSPSRFAADQPRSLAENMALTPDLSGARSPMQPSSDPFGSMFPKSLMLMRSMLSGIGSFGGGYRPYMGNQYSGMGYMGGGGYGSYMGGPYAGMGYNPYMGGGGYNSYALMSERMGGGGYNPYMGGGYNPYMGGGYNPYMGGGYNPYMGGGYNPYMGGGGYSPNMGMLGGLGSMFGGYGSFSGSGGSPYSSPVSA